MKAHLLYRDRDFDMEQELPPSAPALTQDLALNTLFSAMACDDKFVFQVAKHAVLSGLQDDLETILYRQAVLKDCLRNHSIVETIYDVAVEALESKKKQWWFGFSKHFPSGTLHGAVVLLQMLMGMLGKLKRLADEHSDKFESEGFTAFFAMLKAELADDYFASVKAHLKELKFRQGVLVSAELGKGNEGTNYVLRKPLGKESWWIERILPRRRRAYTFRIADRDEGGARALGELRDRGINLAANALAQSTDHILSFFVMLQRELAFYLACVNLHRQLGQKGVPVCFPVPVAPGLRRHRCAGLRDVCLALSMERTVVGNDLDAEGKKLCIITGANQGGKSTFLRSVGLAQLMMQCGMFVTAESFSADTCRSLFAHYKREEDATMKSGKLDEELSRMSDIVNALTPDSMLLFNESFAATNEREGSEIARQIVSALLDARVKIFFVTHLYEFASRFTEEERKGVLFLRAERQANGRRTFKLLPGKPLETSFGEDLYGEIFGDAAHSVGAV
jgi:DNA mismatch repair ATPase MutS